MKKLCMLFIASAIIVSCKTEEKVDYAIVSGKVSNSSSNKLIIRNQYDISERTDSKLDSEGSFIDTIQIDKPSFYSVLHNRNMVNLYLSKGDNVNITFDAKNADSTLVITGKGSGVANYLTKKFKLTTDVNKDMKALYSKNEEEFKKTITDLKTELESELEKIEGLSDDFKASEKRSLQYQYLTTLFNYEPYHGYVTQKRDFKASENFNGPLENIDVENEEDFIFSAPYRQLVSYKLSTDARKMIMKDSTLIRETAMLKAIGNLKNQTIKNRLAYDQAKSGITYTEDLEDYYNLYMATSTDEKNNAEITETYNKLKKLVEGQPSPKFANYENNAGGTTSLDDLKGKYVYIDVWATWCGPCIAEIPSLKKVEKEFHNNNIEFVSISIDNKKDHEKWKKMIVDRELGGMQLFADSDWGSQFIQDYMIKGIPRFILLDPQGNIIKSNAPRPSDRRLVELFKELNI